LISIGESVLPAVPNDAIVNFQGQDYIFAVAKAPNISKEDTTKAEREKTKTVGPEISFEKIQVVKGVSDIGYTEITIVKDIPQKTQIVTKGAFFVLAKMTNIGEEE